MDCEGGFTGNAAKEVKEETGIEIQDGELMDLTGHDAAISMSCGISDECMKFYLYQKTMPEAKILELKGRLTGCESESERIILTVVPVEELKERCVDAKTLAALALYEGMPQERDEEQAIRSVHEAVHARSDDTCAAAQILTRAACLVVVSC